MFASLKQNETASSAKGFLAETASNVFSRSGSEAAILFSCFFPVRFILFSVFAAFFLTGCGYDFYMNKPSVKQIVSVTRGDQTLSLDSEAAVDDDFYAAKLKSDFFRGYAEIKYEKGQYHVKYRNLPIDEDKMKQLEKDIYAIYFAGDYPYKATNKMFGKTVMSGRTKTVYDTDGYELYKVTYSNNQIYLYNNLMEYSLVIDIGGDSWGQN